MLAYYYEKRYPNMVYCTWWYERQLAMRTRCIETQNWHLHKHNSQHPCTYLVLVPFFGLLSATDEEAEKESPETIQRQVTSLTALQQRHPTKTCLQSWVVTNYVVSWELTQIWSKMALFENTKSTSRNFPAPLCQFHVSQWINLYII